MASAPLSALLSLVLTVVTWFGDSVEAVVPIFWDGTQGEFTFVGAITGVGVGISFTLLVVFMIKSLIRFR